MLVVGSQETSLLVGQVVEQADPLDRQLVLAAPKIDLNQFHCRMLWEQVDYSVDPMVMRLAAVAPKDLAILMPPAVVVQPYLLHFDFPIRLVVAGPDFVIPTRQAVVEQSLALPNLQIVAVEQDFGYSAQLGAVDQVLAPPGLPPAAVLTAPTHYWAVAQAGKMYDVHSYDVAVVKRLSRGW